MFLKKLLSLEASEEKNKQVFLIIPTHSVVSKNID
jgi:hypothetical protein